MMLKAAAIALVLGMPVVAANRAYERYERPIANLPAQGGPSCIVLDPTVFAHAADGLHDLRLYANGEELPYAVRGEEPFAASTALAVELVNKGETSGHTSFDALMTRSGYEDLELTVNARDFIATITVWGSQLAPGTKTTKIGEYTLFDLSRQRLGRSTVLHLPPSSFQYLHFEIAGPIHPEQVTELRMEATERVKPSYVTVQSVQSIERKGKQSVVTFTVPARVPVDRVVVVAGAEPAQFSRAASVTVAPADPPKNGAQPTPPVEESGSLIRVHSLQNGTRIDRENLTLTPPRSYSSVTTLWTVRIDNGDDRPLDLREVRLEMAERRLCFNARPGAATVLVYGDALVTEPSYDYARIFSEDQQATRAQLGPEQLNAAWKPRPDERAFTEKHPALLWIALLLAVGTLGWIAFRSFPLKNSES